MVKSVYRFPLSSFHSQDVPKLKGALIPLGGLAAGSAYLIAVDRER